MRMSESFLRMRISLRYAEPVRLDGCPAADSVSKFSISSFNSISVHEAYHLAQFLVTGKYHTSYRAAWHVAPFALSCSAFERYHLFHW